MLGDHVFDQAPWLRSSVFWNTAGIRLHLCAARRHPTPEAPVLLCFHPVSVRRRRQECHRFGSQVRPGRPWAASAPWTGTAQCWPRMHRGHSQFQCAPLLQPPACSRVLEPHSEGFLPALTGGRGITSFSMSIGFNLQKKQMPSVSFVGRPDRFPSHLAVRARAAEQRAWAAPATPQVVAM